MRDGPRRPPRAERPRPRPPPLAGVRVRELLGGPLAPGRAHPGGERGVGRSPARAAGLRRLRRRAGTGSRTTARRSSAGPPASGTTTGRPAASASSTAIPNGSRGAQCSRHVARAELRSRIVHRAERTRPPRPGRAAPRGRGALRPAARRRRSAARRRAAAGAPAASGARARTPRAPGRAASTSVIAPSTSTSGGSAGAASASKPAASTPGWTISIVRRASPAGRGRAATAREGTSTRSLRGCGGAHQPGDRAVRKQVVVRGRRRAARPDAGPRASAPRARCASRTARGSLRLDPLAAAPAARACGPRAARARARDRGRSSARSSDRFRIVNTRIPRDRAASASGPSGHARHRSGSQRRGPVDDQTARRPQASRSS